jgi:hypothetical protein
VKHARGDKAAAAEYARRAIEPLTNSLGQQHRLTQDADALLRLTR